MFQEERLERIMTHLTARRRATMEELCEILSISKDTARRDLIKLEELGELVRTRGGAMLPSISKEIDRYERRMEIGLAAKRNIARAAAGLIHPGDYLLLDSSTTVQITAESIAFSDNIVVTNSIDIAVRLAERPGVALHVLGGALHKEQRFLHGPRTISALADYRFDKLLLGACGISADGLSYPEEDEGHLLREMLKRADQVIMLADASKFGKRLFYQVGGLDSMDILVTDRRPPEDIMTELEKNRVEVIIAGADEEYEGGKGETS